MGALCYVCWHRTEETVCPACSAVVDPQLPLEDDSSCYDGSCGHPMCIAERTEHVERGMA